MKRQRPSRGVTKGEWLDAGLQVLREQGAAGFTVDVIARSLGIARAGFYWHFEDRDDLVKHILEHWVHEATEVITSNVELLALEPKSRLAKASRTIVDHELGRYDIAVRQWALQIPLAARVARKVNRTRLDFVRGAFSELGFTGDDLEARAMLFVCYHAWESTTFGEISKKRRRELAARSLDLLTSAWDTSS